MSSHSLHILGTSSQVPTRHRCHNGYVLRFGKELIAFDPGEGFQRQMLLHGIRASQISTVCISHFHGDHCLGLPGLIQRFCLDRVDRPVKVYFPKSGAVYFDRLRDASIYQPHTPIIPVPINDESGAAGQTENIVLGETDDTIISARALAHTVPCFGFSFRQKDSKTIDPAKLSDHGLDVSVDGPKIGMLKKSGAIEHHGKVVNLNDVSTPKPGKKFAFVMDTKLCDSAVELSTAADLVLAESTYLLTEQTEATERGHMTAHDAATLAKQAGVRKLILSHFSQRHPDESAFADEARVVFENVSTAVEGDVFEF